MGLDHQTYAIQENQGIQLLYENLALFPMYISTEGENILVGYACRDFDCTGEVIKLDNDFNTSIIGGNCIGRNKYAIEDQFGTIWMADEYSPYRYLRPGQSDCSNLYVNSINSANIFDINVQSDNLWVASGGYDSNFSYLFRRDGISYRQTDGQWKTINSNNTDTLNDVLDFIDIEIHPITQKVYAASYYDGLVEIDTSESITVYDEFNSTLGTGAADPLRARVGGIDFDDQNNLWISNYGANNPISVLTDQGEWLSFRPSNGENRLIDALVDRRGYKWFLVGGVSDAALIYDSGEDLQSITDDRWRYLRTSNSNIESNNSYSLHMDREGAIWIGTQEGPILFECGDPFDQSNCRGFRPIGQTDNIGAILLETEKINTIATDGANRIWFGTDNGIFILNGAADEQLFTYTSSNSPLLSNIITSIEIDSEGYVYVGSSKGLQRLRTDASSANAFHSSLEVFPNPIRPEYSGPIIIKGMAEDAIVKITDLSGALVFQTEALGGQAIWDGNNLNGQRVSTGVYLIFVSSVESFSKPSTESGKLLFIK